MMIHFGIDKFIDPFLDSIKVPFHLNSKTLKKIKDRNKIEIVSIKSKSIVNEKVVKGLPNLKLVITRTVGIDHVNLDDLKKRNIALYNIPNYGSENIAQHAIALLLVCARNIIKADKATHNGVFSYENFQGINLKNKTLGVIGTGKIGLEVIKIAKVLGMKILAFDVYLNKEAEFKLDYQYVSLKKLLKESDVITLHLPLLPETKYLINEKSIKLMKNGAILINTARGELINTKALIKNIEKFHTVALDVLEDEKNFSKNNPLLKFDNVIITPHCAFFTDASVKVIARETEENINRFKKGDKTNRII